MNNEKFSLKSYFGNSQKFLFIIATVIAIVFAIVMVGGSLFGNSGNSQKLTLDSIEVKDDKLRIDYFFWLRCGACNALEPYMAEYYKNLDNNTEMIFTPVGWPNAKNDIRPFYIINKMYEDKKFDRVTYMELISKLFDITFKDNKALTSKNIFDKINQYSLFKDFEEYTQYVSNNEEYLYNKVKYSEEITRLYSVSSVPTLILDKIKITNPSDFNNDPLKMLSAINQIAKQKSEVKTEAKSKE